MKVLALDPDLIVFVSAYWQTTCTAVRSGPEGFLIDSPIYPHELDALPGVLAQAGFAVSGLLTTHADWDHLLGRLAFPQASLGCGESTAKRLADEPGAAQRELREFDEQQYVERRTPLSLPSIQPLPVPGRLSIGDGDHELELHAAEGHTADGTVYVIPWLSVLVCGDYLSPVEIPWISPGGSVAAYLETLERLQPLVERVDTVIPGHGGPLDRDPAQRVLDEDREYLEALRRRGPDAELPRSRRSGAQRRIHAENAERLVAS